jgi:hypothetical protein
MLSMKLTTTALCCVLATCVCLTGCTMAPTYDRPKAPIPDAWPGGAVSPQQAGKPPDRKQRISPGSRFLLIRRCKA